MRRRRHAQRRGYSWYLLLLCILLLMGIAAGALVHKTWRDGNNGSGMPSLLHIQDAATRQTAQRLQNINFAGTVLVIKNGRTELSLSRGYADKASKRVNAPHTSYEIDSVQKSLTAALIMQEIKAGKLKLSTKLSKFYPQVPGSRHITIRRMLDMTSGLYCPSFVMPTYKSDAQVVQQYIQHVRFNTAKMNTWQYQPVNYNLLAGILHKVTGQAYARLLTRRILLPMHLDETHFAYQNGPESATGYTWHNNAPNYAAPFRTTHTAEHYELGTGQLFMTAGDLYRAEAAVVSGKLLGAAASNILHHGGSISTYAGGLYHNQRYYFANGYDYGFSTFVRISPNGKNAVIVMCNAQASDHRFKQLADDLAAEYV
ncbi:serine hydrolase domain-containing protein [Lacticaseibacillus songhuajiangensis]|jgi:CubicO group peptidase (beta-lactamase class C family)|uniref:serine hydrolase domain-containing protein n=1 Tax=Lacticaseibacillus songhuajiangensis TaxID=1296539 RepID=UPI000F78B2DB|nr:serine hydrolase domain-containing protein [Lacticaseibacillus songhuajiangensis]